MSYGAAIAGTISYSGATVAEATTSSEAAVVGTRMCSEATHAGTKIWAEPAVAAAKVQVEATAADAFVPAEAAFAPARANAHATYITMGRAATLQEQSEGAALRRRVSFGGVPAPTHLRKGVPASSARQSTLLHSTPSAHPMRTRSGRVHSLLHS